MPNEIIFHAYTAKWYYILAWIIRIKTNSKVDHCSVEIPGYGIYEAKLGYGVTVSHEHRKEPVKSIKVKLTPEMKQPAKPIKTKNRICVNN